MKRNRKILLAGGDSLTEHTLVSWGDPSISTDFPRWPEVLAKKLDMECVNLGRSGCSNQLISTSIFEYLMKNPKKEIGLVCCLWTDYTRTSLYNMPNWPANIISRLFSKVLREVNDSEPLAPPQGNMGIYDNKLTTWDNCSDRFLDLLYYYAKSTDTKSEIIVENIVKNTIKIFHDLECMLSLRNVPYIFGQGAFPFADRKTLKKDRGLEKIYAPPDEQLLFYLLKYEKYFNKEKFVEWPGLLITTPKPHWSDEPAKYFISDEDMHPNETGHQIMANYCYKKIEELYPHLFKKETNE